MQHKAAHGHSRCHTVTRNSLLTSGFFSRAVRHFLLTYNCLADFGLVKVGLADVGLADVGLSDVGLADAGLATPQVSPDFLTIKTRWKP